MVAAHDDDLTWAVSAADPGGRARPARRAPARPTASARRGGSSLRLGRAPAGGAETRGRARRLHRSQPAVRQATRAPEGRPPTTSVSARRVAERRLDHGGPRGVELVHRRRRTPPGDAIGLLDARDRPAELRRGPRRCHEIRCSRNCRRRHRGPARARRRRRAAARRERARRRAASRSRSPGPRARFLRQWRQRLQRWYVSRQIGSGCDAARFGGAGRRGTSRSARPPRGRRLVAAPAAKVELRQQPRRRRLERARELPRRRGLRDPRVRLEREHGLELAFRITWPSVAYPDPEAAADMEQQRAAQPGERPRSSSRGCVVARRPPARASAFAATACVKPDVHVDGPPSNEKSVRASRARRRCRRRVRSGRTPAAAPRPRPCARRRCRGSRT